MARKKKHGKHHKKREYRPTYHAKRKKKKKMDIHTKQYLRCLSQKKKPKAWCKKKYYTPFH